VLNAIPHTALWEQLSLLIERLAEACGAPGAAAMSDPRASENEVAEWIENSYSRLEVVATACHAPMREVDTALVTAALPSLTLSIAAVILAHRALRGFGLGLADLGIAGLAWTNLRPLFAAGERVQHGAASVPARDRHAAVLDARELSFRYGGRGEP
jgi:hypothetical protein